MPTRRTEKKHYGSISRCLHWLMAFLILGMLACGLSLSYLPGDVKPEVIEWHKSFGISLLALAAVRLFWRFFNPPPSLPEALRPWVKIASAISHASLYGLMVAIPMAGWLMSSAFSRPVQLFGLTTLPSLIEKNREWGVFFKNWHSQLAYLLVAFIILHVAAALYHHLVCKDDILRRMLKG